MDATRFDALVLRLASRRSLLATIAGVAAPAFGAADAKGKPRRKKKCKHGLTRCKDAEGKRVCVDLQSDSSHCGACDAPCLAGQRCVQEECLPNDCPPGQRRCQGQCVPATCCGDTDCAGGRVCRQGSCVCPPDKPHVCAGTSGCRQCCGDLDCSNAPTAGAPTCDRGVCACPITGTHYCPGRGVCGLCCANADCGGGMQCGGAPLVCSCDSVPNTVQCQGTCVDAQCESQCARSCATPGAVCCGSGDRALICQFAPEQGDPNKHRCLPA
ncbi:MAG TPA: hypothetical protein VFU81_02590 [Thermomicrobiales bacterium]|nr:hypothetical protein [Thermomicrobiales bacterium]